MLTNLASFPVSLLNSIVATSAATTASLSVSNNLFSSFGRIFIFASTLLIIEAMKLENEVLAPCDGVVSEIIVTKGKTVSTKELLLTIK